MVDSNLSLFRRRKNQSSTGEKNIFLFVLLRVESFVRIDGRRDFVLPRWINFDLTAFVIRFIGLLLEKETSKENKKNVFFRFCFSRFFYGRDPFFSTFELDSSSSLMITVVLDSFSRFAAKLIRRSKFGRFFAEKRKIFLFETTNKETNEEHSR